MASLIIGIRMRLTMKAGKSSATEGTLPRDSTKRRMVWNVSSSVAMPRISSTSSISGTGFMKCTPMNFSGRSVAAASRVMESEEVLVPTRASGFRCGHSSAKMARLTSSSSVAASITRSHSPNSAMSPIGAMRSSAALRSSSVMIPLFTWRAMLPLMVASAFSRLSGEMS